MVKKKVSKTASPKNQISIADAFEVILVRLLSSKSELRISGTSKPQSAISMNFTVAVNEGKKQELVLVNVGANVTIDADGISNEQCSHVSGTFQVVFRATAGFPEIDDELRTSLLRNGTSVAWPYLRHFVQSAFSSMGLPPVVLPLFVPAKASGELGQIGNQMLTPHNQL